MRNLGVSCVAFALSPKVRPTLAQTMASEEEKIEPIATKRKVMLIVIDGWGLNEKKHGNAPLHAKTPVMDKFAAAKGKNKGSNLFASLKAHGLAVGLPPGIMGNSEVGHLTIGGGQVQYQDLVRINKAVETGAIRKNEALLKAMAHAKRHNSKLHFLGLGSDGGVHSHLNHLKDLLIMAKENGVPRCFVHFFGDGRDTAPDSGVSYMQDLMAFMKEHTPQYHFGLVCGRYYAMDRDKRWERTCLAFEALTQGKGEVTTEAALLDAVRARYAKGECDEFLKPLIVDREGMIVDNDAMVFFDFRADRMRQIVESFGVKPPFETNVVPKNVHVVQFTRYSSAFDHLPVVFPPQSFKNVLADWLAQHNVPQFHTAETEKYAHVTFFFNGGVEKAYPGETRFLVNSPKVATYDLQPEMSMPGVRDAVKDALASDKYPFVMCNLAPPDMVGHTGMWQPTVDAVEACDTIIGEIYEECQKRGYVLLITSDHGNCEEMLTPDNKPITKHTTHPVMLVVAGNDKTDTADMKLLRPHGELADVAPTVLTLLGLPVPKVGISLAAALLTPLQEHTGKSMVSV